MMNHETSAPQNIFSVKNNVALITGASSGIGRFCALTLAKYGANVILVARNQERLAEVVKSCQEHHVKVISITADIQNSGDILRIIEESKNHFNQVDIVINAAGIGMRVPSLDLTEEQWNKTIDTNLKGTFLVSQGLAKWMVETKTPGRIINISSSAAFHITKTRPVYSASKIAVESLTRSLALELADHQIRVNCIAPGFFITDLTRNYITTDLGKTELAGVPMKRAANLSEMEGVLLLLASNASSYITGSIINIDGGYAIGKL